MKISIIVPMYKVEKYIEKCLLSCLRQDIPSNNYEIIVVNDGSPDNSLQIAETIAKNKENIRIISQPNGGLSAARNIGMREAKGDYYMFLDSDDWIADNCLGKILSKLNKEQPDALAICAANVVNGNDVRRQSYPDDTPIKGRDLLKTGISPCAPFSIWKADFLKKYELTFYEGIFHEDSEFTPRAYYLAGKVSFMDDIIYYVCQNSTSITRSVNPKKSFDLVTVVCERLSSFANNVSDEYKVIFYDMIGMYLNNAMFHIRYSDQEIQKKLNYEIVKRPQFWDDLAKSSKLKYRIEAMIVKIIPKHPLTVYKMMQLLQGK